MAAESPSGSDVEILGHCLKDGMVAFHQYNCGCPGPKKHRTHVADKCGTKPTEPWPQELVLTLRSFVEKFPTKLQTEMLGENETPAVAELVPHLVTQCEKTVLGPMSSNAGTQGHLHHALRKRDNFRCLRKIHSWHTPHSDACCFKRHRSSPAFWFPCSRLHPTSATALSIIKAWKTKRFKNDQVE